MSDLDLLRAHQGAQRAAKTVLAALPQQIHADDTEQTIADKAYAMLRDLHYADTWYDQSPVLVLLGSRSCLSMQENTYTASDEKVGMSNLITVYVSPTLENYWGDCSRSFAVENGRVTQRPSILEWRAGLYFLAELQRKMMSMVRPDTSFGQLFEWANLTIRQRGFVNLECQNNIGHDFARTRADRELIRANNTKKLGDTPFFSFESFVRLKGGSWGFKREDVFFFDELGQIKCL